MNEDFRNLKKELDEEVFTKYEFKSQKDEILRRIKNKSTKKGPGLKQGLMVMAAIFLVSILSASFIFQDKEQNTPTEEVDTPPITEEYNEKVTDKTAEEWISYFTEMWSVPREPFEKLYLTYSSKMNGTTNIESSYVVNSEYKDGQIIVKSNSVKDYGDYQLNDETIIEGSKITTIFHSGKSFQTFEVEVSIEKIYYDPIYIEPLLPKVELLNMEEGTWQVDEFNEQEGWVVLSSSYQESGPVNVIIYNSLKIDIEHGIILEAVSKRNNEESSRLIVEELKINEEIDKLDLDISIPDHYEDLNEKYKNLVKLEESWMTATNNYMKEELLFDHLGMTGEGGYLNFGLYLKENGSEQQVQQLVEKTINYYTDAANNSEAYQSKETTIWGKDLGQYMFDIIIITPSEGVISKGRMNGVNEDGYPLIEWE
ncbi:hypothetical protein [Fredinandcohnia sp. 179-A 10B2 NHS]|uniref:hypothetical protein n=1 Tax=Fredinandcohnia sp. 179-A 10B2 NHS TaxID=3235176 RepID=UPI00399FA906